jgi:4-hydroxybenzoate polyprenyltransferase
MRVPAFIRSAGHFFIYTNIFLAFCVTSLVVETYIILFGKIVDAQYPLFLFCSTLTLYCFHRLYRFNSRAGKEKLADRHAWTQQHRSLFLAVLAFAVTGVLYSLFFFVSFRTVLYLLPVGLISFGYTVPCLPSRKGLIRLRDIPGIKIFLIALVLGLTTVMLPALAYERMDDLYKPSLLFVFFRRMLFIFAITIPFDIRDMEYDAANGTRTIPVVFGIKRAKMLALIALVLMVVLEVVQYILFPSVNLFYFLALAVSALISAIVILLTQHERKEGFYSFFTEGMMLLQCLLVIGASKL